MIESAAFATSYHHLPQYMGDRFSRSFALSGHRSLLNPRHALLNQLHQDKHQDRVHRHFFERFASINFRS